jgi:hypothetical protein
MCCSLYDEDMFKQMEWHVLNTLGWSVGHPTVDSFLQIGLKEGLDGVEVEHMAGYVCEVALYHKEFVPTKLSVMARASMALARGIFGRCEIPNLDHIENLTVLGLFQRLHETSQILSRKYSWVQVRLRARVRRRWNKQSVDSCLITFRFLTVMKGSRNINLR